MSNRFYAGTRKGLFRYDRDPAGDWSCTATSFLGTAVPMLLPDPRDVTLYAAVEHGHFGTKLHRSTDHGDSWQELDPPGYPPKPNDAPDIRDPHRNRLIPWSLEKIWSLEPGGPRKSVLSIPRDPH